MDIMGLDIDQDTVIQISSLYKDALVEAVEEIIDRMVIDMKFEGKDKNAIMLEEMIEYLTNLLSGVEKTMFEILETLIETTKNKEELDIVELVHEKLGDAKTERSAITVLYHYYLQSGKAPKRVEIAPLATSIILNPFTLEILGNVK